MEDIFNSLLLAIHNSGRYLLIFFPIVMPFVLFYVFWIIRFRWLTMKFVESQKTCLLQIKLPKEITKSPAAMEIFFSQLNPGGAGGYAEAFIDGKTRPWFSCEIVSLEGEVRFYIWCSQAKFKNLVEAQLYAQYPNVEIYEVEDYTKDLIFDLEKYKMHTVQFTLSKPDPLPIKTYIDYGLDKDQKDEYKIDPITSVLEYLGSMKKGEYGLIQILFQKQEDLNIKHGTFAKSKKLSEQIKEEIEKIRKESITETGDEDSKIKFPNPTKGQIERIAAIERSNSKQAFECMIRALYIAEKDSFNPINIAGILGSFKQYNFGSLNGFKIGTVSDVSDLRKDIAVVLPFFSKRNDKKISDTKKSMFFAYKLRSYFQHPYKNYGDKKPFILTSEELATIFHFPSGIVSQTPTLKRVGSKKSEAPSNLPI